MFKHLAALPGLRTSRSEHVAIEGLFDNIGKLWGRPEKKAILRPGIITSKGIKSFARSSCAPTAIQSGSPKPVW